MAKKSATAAVTEQVNKNLMAVRGALEHSVSIQTVRLQELVDGLVARGALTRAEADQFFNTLVESSKGYTTALLAVIDSATGPVVAPVVAGAGRVVDAVRNARHVPMLVPNAKRRPKKPVVATKPVPVVAPVELPVEAVADAPADAPAEAPAEPIANYGALSVADLKPRLAGLSRAELAQVRDLETAGKARKGVLAEVERLLNG